MKRYCLLFLVILAGCAAPQATNTPAPTPAVRASSTPTPAGFPDLRLGENLTEDELMAVNRRVMEIKRKRGLSDKDSMILFQREVEKAARAKANQTQTQ